MQVIRVLKKQEDGTYDVDFKLDEKQVGFLINFALGILVQRGIAAFIDTDENGNIIQSEAEQEEAQQFQQSIDPTKLN